LKNDLIKSNSIKLKMENLSRELSRENKRLKDDLIRLTTLEQTKREEMTNKLEKRIQSIEEMVSLKPTKPIPPTFANPTTTPQSNLNLNEDEIEKRIKERLKDILDQYELREKYYECVLRAKDLEVQLLTAKSERDRRFREDDSKKLGILQDRLGEGNL